jgi:pantetheine-phosphate adenylyltransferase
VIVATGQYRVAVYTGSFDPFHLGHENVVRRAVRIVDRVVIGVGDNPDKAPIFTAEERVEMIRQVIKDLPTVAVKAYAGLSVRFAREQNAAVVLRGIRALSDIEYEFTMTLSNASLDPGLETVFLMAQKEYSHLSSSLIRQIARFGGDLEGFVPPAIQERLRRKFAERGDD